MKQNKPDSTLLVLAIALSLVGGPSITSAFAPEIETAAESDNKIKESRGQEKKNDSANSSDKHTGKSVKDAREGKVRIAPGQFVSLFRMVQNSSMDPERKRVFMGLLLELLADADVSRDNLRDQRDELKGERSGDDDEKEDAASRAEFNAVEIAIEEYYDQETVTVLEVEREDAGFEAKVELANGDLVEVELDVDYEITSIDEYEDDDINEEGNDSDDDDDDEEDFDN